MNWTRGSKIIKFLLSFVLCIPGSIHLSLWSTPASLQCSSGFLFLYLPPYFLPSVPSLFLLSPYILVFSALLLLLLLLLSLPLPPPFPLFASPSIPLSPPPPLRSNPEQFHLSPSKQRELMTCWHRARWLNSLGVHNNCQAWACTHPSIQRTAVK